MASVRRPFLSFIVEPEDDGKRLQSVLRTRYSVSSGMIRRLKHDQCAFINDQSVKMTDRVRAGDHVQLLYRIGEESIVIPERMVLKIIYEDRDIIVVDKPAAMLVHPSGKTLTGTLANGIAAHLRHRNEPSTAGPVTRLDRHTSGIVLFAKHPYAHHRLSESMGNGRLRRTYTAVAKGTVALESGTISIPIRRVEGSIVKREVGDGGQHSVTHFIVKERLASGDTVLQLTLETGRTHQIRVHLDHVGHPLIGDPDYGSVHHPLIQRQALHASELQLIHPADQRWMTFSSPLPADMAALIENLQDR